MLYELRKATEGDIEFLLELRRATMDSYLLQERIDISDTEHLLRIRYCFEDAKIITIEDARVGLFKASYFACKSQWYVYQLQILPTYQGLGIGKSIISGLCKNAVEENFSVGLGVLKSNPAKRLYDRLGFKVVESNGIEYEMVYGT